MEEPQVVTGDGCSGGVSWAWRKLTGSPPPWEGACDNHDFWYSGARTLPWTVSRATADRWLREEVVEAGHPVWAWILWAGVRVGGGRYAPPLHLLAKPFVWLGWAESAPDYRWGRVK